MPSNLKANCRGFATGCRKLYSSSVGVANLKRWEHCSVALFSAGT